MNLRELAESDLLTTLEGEWALPVTLISPDAETQTGIMGQVLYDTVRVNPETGEDMVVGNPVVSLRRSSLNRVPLSGENWIVKIPTIPSFTAPLEDFVIDPTRPIEGGRSIGFIRLYLRKVVQC
jgi:hypothetical protein